MTFLDPARILDKLDLKQDFIAADFGCGSGGWVIPLAKRLKRGKIYAIDILQEPLSALKSRVKFEKLTNIETINSDVEKTSRLLANSCDLVLMTNLLFETDNKKQILEEGKKILRPGGKILIVDWNPEAPLTVEVKVSPPEVKKIAQALNLKLEEEFKAGIYHWGLIFAK